MLKAGSVVHCIAGHDKDRFYVVTDVREDRVSIADGKLRKLQKPKWKNPLHLRPTTHVLDLDLVSTDKRLRLALAAFQNKRGAGPTDERED